MDNKLLLQAWNLKQLLDYSMTCRYKFDSISGTDFVGTAYLV